MSIWKYLNDIELASLKEINQEITKTKNELGNIERTIYQQQSKLRSAAKYEKDLQENRLNAAIGNLQVEVLAPEETAEDVQFLIDGLEGRRIELASKVTATQALLKSKANDMLHECIIRASVEYGAAAETLVEHWKELSAAQLAFGQREVSWIHCFIPALKCMPQAYDSHARPCLFSGKDFENYADGSVQAELDALFG